MLNFLLIKVFWEDLADCDYESQLKYLADKFSWWVYLVYFPSCFQGPIMVVLSCAHAHESSQQFVIYEGGEIAVVWRYCEVQVQG